MKISTKNSFGFITTNHPVIKVTPPTQPVTPHQPKLVKTDRNQKKKA